MASHSGSQSVDEIIANLLDMGFSFDDAQCAVQIGCKSVQTAVEWISNGKHAPSESDSPPRLTLGAAPPISPRLTLGAAPPISLGRTQADKNVLGLSSSASSGQGGNSEQSLSPASFATPQPISNQPGVKVQGSKVSQPDEQPFDVRSVNTRYKGGAEKEKLRHKQMEERKKEIQRDKLDKERVNKRVREQIEEDKEKRRHHKMNTQPGTVAPVLPSAATSSTAGSSSSSGPSTGTGGDLPAASSDGPSTQIMVRMPSGQSFKNKFNSLATLNDVRKWLLLNGPVTLVGSFAFLQPFPRREFTDSEDSETLISLGLSPSAVLTVKTKEGSAPAASASQSPLEGVPPVLAGRQPHELADVMREQVGRVRPHDPRMPFPMRLPGMHRQGHDWGEGNQLERPVLGNIAASPPPADRDLAAARRRGDDNQRIGGDEVIDRPFAEDERMEGERAGDDNPLLRGAEDVAMEGLDDGEEVNIVDNDDIEEEEEIGERLNEGGPVDRLAEPMDVGPERRDGPRARRAWQPRNRVLNEDIWARDPHDDDDDEEEENDDEDEDEHAYRIGGGRGGQFGVLGGGGIFGGEGGMLGRRGGFHRWGAGAVLNPNTDRPSQQPPPEREGEPSARDAIRDAWQSRAPTSPPSRRRQQPSSSEWNEPLHNLSEQCIHRVISVISQPSATAGEYRLPVLPPLLYARLLRELMERKLLLPRRLRMFLPCKMTELNLDNYKLMTNEMMSVIGLNILLVELSVANSTMITDQGVQHLTALSRLKILNLQGCSQLSDQSIKVIKGLKKLERLILSDTRITTEGVTELCVARLPSLSHLHLGGLALHDSVLLHLGRLPVLNLLNLQATKVTELYDIEMLQKVTTLNLSLTPIVAKALDNVIRMPSLTSLNLQSTPLLGNSDRVLQTLSVNLKLRSLELPCKDSVTDEGIICIAQRMPLQELVLTNFSNVTDKSCQHIATMKSLKLLDLSGTKVTDSGASLLKSLTQLESLYMDRLPLTKASLALLQSLTHLKELSLSHTGLSNQVLTEGFTVMMHPLSRLNLSHTPITNEGLRNIIAPNLTFLDVTGTGVDKSTAADIARISFPKLKTFRV